MTKHVLPELPYPYNALEPYMDEATVRLHHDKHHQAYVDGLNKAEEKIQEAREKGDYALIKHWERELAFHGSGHLLHTLYWENMKPNGGGEAAGPIAEQIARDFGSFAVFRAQFKAAAVAVEGSGWAILGWNPKFNKLEILTAEKHQNLTQWGVVPLLTVDVWEHAYYLKYQNRRADFVEAWFNLINWDDVNNRFSKLAECKCI
ncbi:MAG: superoxide dismutase [Bacillota bacterium]|uniref:Superoxide dismutase n=1 Tax=Thermanaerosceptrum fracticalcis TaxID=1712410 RepID=A0A7G6E3B3_THEFR|nr:superoxide dismutase [Thermanaerosceptrum fracticalcis]QNB46567.1 superoxide dismutase [Thermanaerosceptrum fracticalcis]